ncbi:MAG: adenine phosphoribosyltransferase [Lachnospiraceae bacterium]|nr:adenine phosphoribosyltransferase [Lachnospiraceae bacterium]
MKTIKDYIRTIPDFPEPGIMFRDITTVLQDPDGLKLAIDSMQDLVRDIDFDVIAGAEARGFVFGTPIAYNLHKPMMLVRKKGKLPYKTVSVDYTLEYGDVTTLEIHEDAILPGQKVLLVDDLLATGGTLQAMAKLVEKVGGEVAGILVLLELSGLNGRELLKDYPVFSAVSYEGKKKT